MTYDLIYLHAPGGFLAVADGCLCPVLDNAHGHGYLGGVHDANGEIVYARRIDCPLHGEDRVDAT